MSDAAPGPDYRVRFGPVWRRRTYTGMRAYGWDFGRFALVVLLDREDSRG